MADHGAPEVNSATEDDYQDHFQTYQGFLRATRYGIAGIVILLLFLTWWFY